MSSAEQLSLTGELDAMRSRILELEADNDHLRGLLSLSEKQGARPAAAPAVMFDVAPAPVTVDSTPAQKVAFFASLFRARSDVYAVRWDNDRTGRGGWMPAVAGGFRKNTPQSERRYLPVTEAVLTGHLTGELQIGLYPLGDDDCCHWVAADFDGSTAMVDALSYLKAARAQGVTSALEVSRSGAGAHVWVFFTAAVPASRARQLGTGFLREAMTMSGRLSLASYDRLFPSQDLLPAGGIGNLIAAPLQGRRRQRGTTVFLDLATMEPHEDQWRFLSSIPRLTPAELGRILSRLGAVRTGGQVDRVVKPSASTIDVPVPRAVEVELGSVVRVKAAVLPPALLASLRHAASMPNPAFYDRERRRQSTWDTPRFLRLYDETVEGDLLLPRGMLDQVARLLDRAGSALTVAADHRTQGSAQDFHFAATLTAEQQAAHAALLQCDLGVLVAPPGAGKTVMAAAVIASLGVSTLILVDRKALAEQWRARLHALLDIKVGQRGGGRTKTTGVVDIATLQMLARDEHVAEWTGAYGLVVVDECHHVPAAAFTHAIAKIPAKRWLGLTATPYRKDQLDELITLQLGPVRHTVSRANQDTLTGVDAPVPDPVLHLHTTDFVYAGPASPQSPGGMAAIYRDLVADEPRLAQIVADVVAACESGRNCLVLSQWTSHVQRLVEALQERGHPAVVLRGGMGVKQRTDALAQLQTTANRSLLVVATGPFVGEGFDCPALDTLFLAAPIAFKGRLVQYVGRILRPHPGKLTAEVHDYHDVHEGVLASSLAKRVPGYLSLGFPDPR